jgi:magnesium transporter
MSTEQIRQPATDERRPSTRSGYRRRRAGSSAGELVADPDAQPPVVSVTIYGPDIAERVEDCTLEELEALRRRGAPVIWVDVVGLRDVGLVQRIGEMFGLHRLALEDVINTRQRPKTEPYDTHVFVVARMLQGDVGVTQDQVSFFIGDGFLVTFHERAGDCFGPIRRRLLKERVRIRHDKADYLAYALIDRIIDDYYPVLERYGEILEELEDEVISTPDPSQVDRLHRLRRELYALRRVVWPTREMVNGLIRDETQIVSQNTRVFLRDCYDHAVQLMDVIETDREVVSSLLDVYMSSVSAKMNEVMKVLTVIATIFIPLGFVASLYGMNFNTASPWNMPELELRYGYPMALGIMAAIAGGLLLFFWRRGWIGGQRPPERRR